ncbi:MAG: diaminopimelate epimerase [Abditibacteriaceae bacterium]
MLLPFIKMHGAGNDFVVLDAFANTLPPQIDFSSLAQRLCARHFGIGSDGLLLLEPSNTADARLRMWNPDGTEDMCGNGLRCVAWLFYQRGYTAKSTFTVETLAGLRHATMLKDQIMQVEMGKAIWKLHDIPMNPDKRTFGDEAVEYQLPLPNQNIEHVTSLSTGTTHTVIFVDELPKEKYFQDVSPLIEKHPWFPERTSVLWTKVLSREKVQVRIWERGADETFACGTGACAIAAAAWRTERCEVDEIKVQSKGGILQVQQNDAKELLFAGEVKLVFEGAFEFEQQSFESD